MIVASILPNERAARDIDAMVAKVLRDLADPDPPLQLEHVRELLRLDRQFYSSVDTRVLEEVVHRLRVGMKQVMKRPGLLLDVVKSRKLSALWIPDRRRILIDSEAPPLKHRWNEAHEIGHSLIPWHDAIAHGDPQMTLRMGCELELEEEANFAAGRLLFLGSRFDDEFRSGAVDLGSVRQLGKRFGNTITSTLWRAVESLGERAFGLISQHPRAQSFDQGKPLVEHFIRVPEFQRVFPRARGEALFGCLQSFCRRGGGPIGAGEILIADAIGEEHVFFVECFHNGHSTLTLGRDVGLRKPVIGVVW